VRESLETKDNSMNMSYDGKLVDRIAPIDAVVRYETSIER
jgi:hypothetical protein